MRILTLSLCRGKRDKETTIPNHQERKIPSASVRQPTSNLKPLSRLAAGTFKTHHETEANRRRLSCSQGLHPGLRARDGQYRRCLSNHAAVDDRLVSRRHSSGVVEDYHVRLKHTGSPRIVAGVDRHHALSFVWEGGQGAGAYGIIDKGGYRRKRKSSCPLNWGQLTSQQTHVTL